MKSPRARTASLGSDANADRVSDIAGDELEQLSGDDGLRAGQVPHAAHGALVGAKGRQTRRDVGDVAVGVGQVGVADEVGAFAGDGVAEHALA